MSNNIYTFNNNNNMLLMEYINRVLYTFFTGISTLRALCHYKSSSQESRVNQIFTFVVLMACLTLLHIPKDAVTLKSCFSLCSLCRVAICLLVNINEYRKVYFKSVELRCMMLEFEWCDLNLDCGSIGAVRVSTFCKFIF